MNSAQHIQIDEGSLPLPPGYEDRTTNVLVPLDPQRQPNLSVARDRLMEGEGIGDYVARQVALLKKQLPGYKPGSNAPALLGSGERTLAGVRIDASYRSGMKTVHQRQAAFLQAPGRALVFTISSPRPLDDAAELLWNSWLAGFQPDAEA